MIAGLEQATEGDILIDRRRVNGLDPKDRDVAMVFQSYALYPNMIVYEIIRFPLKVRRADPAEHDARVRRAADHVRIPGIAAPDGPVTLGFRAEDAAIGQAGEIAAPIYTLELLGDATMVTVKAGGALVAIKAPKDFRAEIGDPVAARVPAAICHLFHPTTGERLSR